MDNDPQIIKRSKALPFDEMLIGLAKTMENGAKSLFFLQQATINDSGSDPFPEKCLLYRSNLQQTWEVIIALVEESSEFASEASCVQVVFSTDGEAEINAYFESLCDKCRHLDEASQILLKTYRTPPSPYDLYWEDKLKHQIDQDGFYSNTDRAQAQRKCELGKNAHPNGHEAYEVFRQAKGDLDQFLKKMAYFWADANESFRELGGLQRLTRQQIDILAEKWGKYRLESIRASVNMTNASDALVIRAIGTSKRPEKGKNMKPWRMFSKYGLDTVNSITSKFPGDKLIEYITRQIPIGDGVKGDSGSAICPSVGQTIDTSKAQQDVD